MFNTNCRQELLIPATTEMATYNGDLTQLKRSIIADVVSQGVPVEEAYERFEKENGTKWSNLIAESLNKVTQAEQNQDK